MLGKSTASDDWAEIFKIADFSSTSSKVTKLSKF